jgi:hypothetical protein
MYQIILLILLLFAKAASANTALPQINTVIDERGKEVGHIMHNYSHGIVSGKTTHRVISGLRFICVPGRDVIIGIYRSTVMSDHEVVVTTTVDNMPVMAHRWAVDKTLIFIPALGHYELLQALKSGKTAQFQWQDSDSKTHYAQFSMTGFDFKTFAEVCKLPI